MHLTLERIGAMNDDRLKITLRIADLKTPLALRVDYGADEKYWRDAADLFNKRWAFYKDKYKDGLMDSESMMAMVAVEMARLYCEMGQDRKTLLADLSRGCEDIRRTYRRITVRKREIIPALRQVLRKDRLVVLFL